MLMRCSIAIARSSLPWCRSSADGRRRHPGGARQRESQNHCRACEQHGLAPSEFLDIRKQGPQVLVAQGLSEASESLGPLLDEPGHPCFLVAKFVSRLSCRICGVLGAVRGSGTLGPHLRASVIGYSFRNGFAGAIAGTLRCLIHRVAPNP
jgi:hypothetical protein